MFRRLSAMYLGKFYFVSCVIFAVTRTQRKNIWKKSETQQSLDLGYGFIHQKRKYSKNLLIFSTFVLQNKAEP
jgi:hypothetical protein